MRKLTKGKIIIMFVLLIILFACSKSEQSPNQSEALETFNNTPSPTAIFVEDNNPEKLDSLNIYLWAYPIDHQSREENDNRFVFWEEYIKEKYDVEVKINKGMYLWPHGYYVDGNSIYSFLYGTENPINGIYQIKYEDLPYFIEKGYIQPLGSYVEQNLSWKSMPEELREAGKINDEYYAIPKEYNEFLSINVRGYRSDWLENVGLTTPNTIDEFYEVLMAFTYNDPDQNTINDTHGFNASHLICFQDIFDSFGVPLGKKERYASYWSLSFSYDSKTNQYFDPFKDKNMVAALEWLRQCDENQFMIGDYLHNSQYNSNGRTNSDQNIVGSNYSSYYHLDKIGNDNGFYYNYTIVLKHICETHLYQIVPEEQHCYVLGVNNTNQIASVNWFLDTFYGSKQGYLDGKYGVEKQDDSTDFSYEIINNDIHITSELQFPRIFIVNHQYNLNELYKNNSGEYWERTPSDLYKEEQRLYYEGLQNDIITIIPYMDVLKKETYLRSLGNYEGIRSNDYNLLIINTIVQSISGNVTIEEALENYHKKAKIFGIDEAIDYVNSLEYVAVN